MNEAFLRARLIWVMAFRVAIVTLFFGGLLALDIESVSSLSSPDNVVLLSLIIGTYLLTIVYAVLIQTEDDLTRLARIQLAGDFVITSLLLLVTGGLDSSFTSLVFLPIISTSFISDQKTAYIGATLVSGLFALFFLANRGIVNLPFIVSSVGGRPFVEGLFLTGVNCAAAFVIALLAGFLAKERGEVETKLKQQRLAVRELETLNRDILDSVSSGLLTVDTEGQIIFYNRAAEQITGQNLSANLGEKLGDVLPVFEDFLEEAIGAPLEQINGANESRPEFNDPAARSERQYEKPDGTRLHLGFSASVLKSSRYVEGARGQDSEHGFILIFQDITQLKKLQEEKKRSERLAAVGQLAGSVAHEIRNPLASIQGSLEMLDDLVEDAEVSETEQTGQLLDILKRDVERLNRLVTDFLDYGSLRTFDRDEVAVDAVVDNVANLFENSQSLEGVDFEFDNQCSGDECVRNIDSEALEQVLWNILNNALEAVEETDGEDDKILLRVTCRDRHVVIEIEDTGPGLAPDAEDDIFQPFFTTKDDGTGLGLATSYRIIDEMGGALRAGSADGLTGARFEIALPEDMESTGESPVAEYERHSGQASRG